LGPGVKSLGLPVLSVGLWHSRTANTIRASLYLVMMAIWTEQKDPIHLIGDKALPTLLIADKVHRQYTTVLTWRKRQHNLLKIFLEKSV
jgi:hypothetical protein